MPADRSMVFGSVVARIQDDSAALWRSARPSQAGAARWHAPLIGLDAATVEAANARRSYAVRTVDAPALAEQQRIADAFAAQGILPRKVAVSASRVWRKA